MRLNHGHFYLSYIILKRLIIISVVIKLISKYEEIMNFYKSVAIICGFVCFNISAFALTPKEEAAGKRFLKAYRTYKVKQEKKQTNLARGQLFNTLKSSPLNLLLKMYKTSQILVLGEVNHNNYQSYEYLRELLEEVKSDPHLKFLVVERSFETKEFYQQASLKPITIDLIERTLPNDKSKLNVMTTEGASMNATPFFHSKILPLIQSVNEIVRNNNPVIVLPIDSEPQLTEISGLPAGITLPKSGYFYDSYPEYILYKLSLDREIGTARNFEEDVLKKLDADDKVIVFYHAGHVIQSFKGPLPKLNVDHTSWELSSGSVNWLELILEKHPHLREKTKIVFLDEQDRKSNTQYFWAPEGLFELSKSLSTIDPLRPFAIDLSDFSEYASERGMDVIQKNTDFRHYYGYFASSSGLSDMGHGLIWSPNAYENFYADMFQYNDEEILAILNSIQSQTLLEKLLIKLSSNIGTRNTLKAFLIGFTDRLENKKVRERIFGYLENN